MKFSYSPIVSKTLLYSLGSEGFREKLRRQNEQSEVYAINKEIKSDKKKYSKPRKKKKYLIENVVSYKDTKLTETLDKQMKAINAYLLFQGSLIS